MKPQRTIVSLWYSGIVFFQTSSLASTVFLEE